MLKYKNAYIPIILVLKNTPNSLLLQFNNLEKRHSFLCLMKRLKVYCYLCPQYK